MPPVGVRLWAQGQGVRSMAPLQACLKEQCCLFFIRLSSRSCFFSFSRDTRFFSIWLSSCGFPFPEYFTYAWLSLMSTPGEGRRAPGSLLFF